MDAHAAQFCHQMDETRAAMDAKLTQLAQRVSRMSGVLLERQVLGHGRGVQETAVWATALLRMARLRCRGTWGFWTGLAGAL
jgi:hypothetical protein